MNGRCSTRVTKDIGSQLKAWMSGHWPPSTCSTTASRTRFTHPVKQNVISAGRNITGPDRDLALQVLKALLMTKYIDQFDATPQALAVLLTNKIDTNVAALHEDIERALGELGASPICSAPGRNYHYLTNEEQDVERRSKSRPQRGGGHQTAQRWVVRASAVTAKVRHDATGVDLGLERWLDEDRRGRTRKAGHPVHHPVQLRFHRR